MSDDGKALTLKLRKGVKFHDGTPFNAKAVKLSLGRLISGKVKVAIGVAYRPIKSITGISYQPNEKFETINAHPKGG